MPNNKKKSKDIDRLVERVNVLRSRVEDAGARLEDRVRLSKDCRSVSERLIELLADLTVVEEWHVPKTAMTNAMEGRDAAHYAVLITEWYPQSTSFWESEISTCLRLLGESLIIAKALAEGVEADEHV